jgi:hypothetical protein
MQGMNRFLVCAICAFVAGSGVAKATTVPSTISTTLTITTDSKLTTDVNCAVTVAGTPCIQFGAPGIKLSLNGHTMTGNGVRGNSFCNNPYLGEDGVNTNGKNGVVIQGPGIIRRFNGRGITVSGSYSTVQGVTVISSCYEGIAITPYNNVSPSNDLVENNSIARASLAYLGFNAGIWVQGSHHQIFQNEISAGGALFVSAYPYTSGGAQGIFVGVYGGTPSTNNVIKGNSSSGIPGYGLFFTVGSTGNQVSQNQFLGNLAIADIYDTNTVGQNSYSQNLCEVSQIGPGQVDVACQIPDIAGHEDPENQNQQ